MKQKYSLGEAEVNLARSYTASANAGRRRLLELIEFTVDVCGGIYVEILQQSLSDLHPAGELAEGVDYFAGGVGAGGAGQPVAGVGAGATEEEIADGSSVARPVKDRAHGKELVEG